MKRAKQNRRKAEGKFKKSRLTVDKETYMARKKDLEMAVEKAKRNYYREKLESTSATNAKEFFKTTKSLLGKEKPSRLPSESSEEKLCKRFKEYFHTKITTIRNSMNDDQNHTKFDTNYHGEPLMSFKTISIEDVKRLILFLPCSYPYCKC